MAFNPYTIPRAKLGRSRFNLSHSNAISFNSGEIVPINVIECIPGDVHRVSNKVAVKFAPQIAPIFGRANLRVFTFFVPNRLIWDSWKDFITNKDSSLTVPSFRSDGRVSSSVTVPPTVMNRVLGHGSLFDYLGYPTSTIPSSTSTAPRNLGELSILRHRAYLLIGREYFSNSATEADTPTGGEEDHVLQWLPVNTSDTVKPGDLTYNFAPKIGFFHGDYFTTALPEPQQGTEVSYTPLRQMRDADGAWDPSDGTFSQASADMLPFGSTGIVIPDFWNAQAVQAYLWNDNIGGDRYIEQLYVRFGVVSSDARLQRPELIDVSRIPIRFSEVIQTSDSNGGADGTPLGDYAGYAMAYSSGSRVVKYRCEEHGYLMQLAQVVYSPAYYRGAPKDLLYRSALDYYAPEFNHIGDDAITNAEVYYPALANTEDSAYPNGVSSTDTWGYAPRNYQYRQMLNEVHGDFRSSLRFWHFGRDFTSLPTFGPHFLQMTRLSKIFAVQPDWDPRTADTIYAFFDFSIHSVRSIPKYSLPKYAQHGKSY